MMYIFTEGTAIFFYFLIPNCGSSYPRNGFFHAFRSIDCSVIQSITEQSDDSIRRKRLLYSKNLPFSIFLLDPITRMWNL